MPVFDSVGGVVFLSFGALGLYQAERSHTDSPSGDIDLAVALPLLAVGTIYVASAIYGAHKVRTCRDAVRAAR